MGLTFVEPRVAPVAELLDTAFRSIPKRGAITGSILLMLQGLVSLLRNPLAIMEHGQMFMDGRKYSNEILESLGLDECYGQVEELGDAEAEENGLDEPLFDGAALPPVIESCGLW